MNSQISLGSISHEGWQITFNSPVVFEVQKEYDKGAECHLHTAWVEGFRDVCEVMAERFGDLTDEYLPAMIVGVLQYNPDRCTVQDESHEQYKLFYNYLKNSIDKIQWIAPDDMVIKATEGNVLELEFK